jgi:hypothetical protein
MKGLSRQQLDAVLKMTGHGPTRGDDHVIFLGDLERIFDQYGDDYFRDYGYDTPWELCRENPIWDDARKKGLITIREGYKI